jgi:hypothetical protein
MKLISPAPTVPKRTEQNIFFTNILMLLQHLTKEEVVDIRKARKVTVQSAGGTTLGHMQMPENAVISDSTQQKAPESLEKGALYSLRRQTGACCF